MSGDGNVDGEDDSTGRNVYVASLPLEMSDALLLNMFCKFGVILSAKIMRERKSRQSRGYGFVLFRDRVAAAAAVQEMNHVLIGSQRLQVRFAHADASRDLSRQCRPVPKCLANRHPCSVLHQRAAPCNTDPPNPSMVVVSPFALPRSSATTH